MAQAVFLCFLKNNTEVSLYNQQYSSLPASGAYKLLCYYSDRAWRRSGPARLMPTDTDPCLCTHLVYAFATIEENKITTADLSDGDLYVLFNNIKKRNLRLLTLLAVGGDEFDMTRFTTMVSSSSNRAIFIDSVIQLLRSFNFDGIDLHFQYPGSGVSPPEDKNRFTLLVQEMMAAFQFESAKKEIPRLMITAAVSAKKATIEAGYEISELSQSLDLISVMTYNFHGGWENMTAHHSPLYEWPTGQGDSVYFNCEYAMKHWKNSTMRSKKLLMGFPTYGRTFTLSTITNCTVLSPASGHGSAGSYTEEAGILAFYEICRIPEGNSTSFQFNRDAQVPYACYGNQWIGYDDQLSFELKVEFLLENGFGGAAVWSLDMDDFNGRFCNKGVYPLTSKLKDLLGLDTDHLLLRDQCGIFLRVYHMVEEQFHRSSADLGVNCGPMWSGVPEPPVSEPELVARSARRAVYGFVLQREASETARTCSAVA
ncbi:hypothetical protein NDU88_004353 [Pleurodeles waltl]|uniref:GH18 domain-containing protein n=1 Tax=Pleurodeles waltl TaxID=8319 RepID=A0AAV7QI60_PLEWA|nr:hypothetical protein NDU88_004353 [Pleurodeles waltl]